jgi:endonuclease/exonuclease/phosphatase family metal-dependent hydrolase
MRLVSYNILDGGEGRADPLAEVILAQRADIIALVEADNLTVLERVAQRLHMDYVHARGPRDKGSAILSRWAIRETIDHGALRADCGKSLLEAIVTAPDGRDWTVGVVHLSARAREEDEQRREREIDVALDVFAEHRRRNLSHLLAGDFNANAPSQQIDPARCKPATREAWQANGGMVPRRVVRKILDAGYVDSLHARGPLQAQTAGSFSTQHPGQRVDYVFTFGFDQATIRRAWIETDRLAKYASDHFPVGVEIAD